MILILSSIQIIQYPYSKDTTVKSHMFLILNCLHSWDAMLNPEPTDLPVPEPRVAVVLLFVAIASHGEIP